MSKQNNKSAVREDNSANHSLLTEMKPVIMTEKSEIARPATQQYALTEIPPISVSLFVAMQHVLVSLASALTMSAVVSDALCADLSHPIRARLFATTLFMSGLCTILQTLLGVRLPVFQGPSSSFLVPLIGLAINPGWRCEDDQPTAMNNDYAMQNSTVMVNITSGSPTTALSLDEKLQQLSGSLMVASLLEVLVGGLGLIRLLLHYIGPLTVAPTIALIGLSLFELPVAYAKFNPAVTLGSALLVVVFSLYMSNIQLPMPSFRKGHNRTYLPVFQLLPILLAMMVMWILCAVLTVTDVIPDDKDHPYYYSRTDSKLNIITNTPWFQITYPGQFGPPSFSVAATIGFLAATMASMVESVGDYYAAAKCCNVMTPPDHAMSRGILVEGIGSCMSGAVGAAHATTSYSGNIAMLSLTQTASRSVLVLAGAILVMFSLVGKVGAALASLPPPILGGILLVVLGLLATVGLSTLKYADMTSNRNLVITGVAFMSGLAIPTFMKQHGHTLVTGNEHADQIILVVLGTPMFLGGVIAFILDNTVPGTDLERGITGWKKSHSSAGNSVTQHGDTELSSPLTQPDSIDTKGGSEAVKTDKDQIDVAASNLLTENDVYAFRVLKGRLSSRLWRYVPFLPPNMIRYEGANSATI